MSKVWEANLITNFSIFPPPGSLNKEILSSSGWLASTIMYGVFCPTGEIGSHDARFWTKAVVLFSGDKTSSLDDDVDCLVSDEFFLLFLPFFEDDVVSSAKTLHRNVLFIARRV